MAAMQRAMLENAAALVRPGGVIVYSVCSLAPQEGEGVVRGFLAEHPEFAIDRAGGGVTGVLKLSTRRGSMTTGPDAAASTAFSPRPDAPSASTIRGRR